MKVRWTTGSLRLRISPSELERLQRGETITVALSLPGGGIGWEVALCPAAAAETRLCHGDRPGAITFFLSAADIACLSEPTREGIYFADEFADNFADNF